MGQGAALYTEEHILFGAYAIPNPLPSDHQLAPSIAVLVNRHADCEILQTLKSVVNG